MKYKIIVTDNFYREFKRLLKKHPRLKEALQDIVPSLAENPTQGVSLGKNCYKIRLSAPDKSSGKSGGFRLVAHVAFKEGKLFLLSIYDKSQLSTLKDSAIKELLKELKG